MTQNSRRSGSLRTPAAISLFIHSCFVYQKHILTGRGLGRAAACQGVPAAAPQSLSLPAEHARVRTDMPAVRKKLNGSRGKDGRKGSGEMAPLPDGQRFPAGRGRSRTACGTRTARPAAENVTPCRGEHDSRAAPPHQPRAGHPGNPCPA